jgi:hypothetical protein
VFAAHSASSTHARHVSRLALQTGVGLSHSESSRHCTHMCVAASQALLVQSLPVTHATQAPVAVSQAWLVLVVQSAFDAQPRHVPVVASQMLVGATQAAWSVASHCTHRPAFAPVVSQTGVAPVQSAAVHARHAPPGSHTGVAPVQSADEHARHVWLVASQIVIGSAHCAAVVHGVGGPAVAQSRCALSKSPCT